MHPTADLKTTNPGKPLPEWARSTIRHLPTATFVVAVIYAVAQFITAMDPTGHLQFFEMGIFMLIFLTPAFIALGVISLIRRAIARGFEQPPPKPMLAFRRVQAGVVILLLSAAATPLRLPLYLGCLTALPQFNSLRQANASNPALPLFEGTTLRFTRSSRAGIYRVKDIARLPGGLVLFTSDRAGFAYLPEGNLADAAYTDNRGRLFGGWWWFQHD